MSLLRGVGDGELTVDALRAELDLIAGAQGVEDHSLHHVTVYSEGVDLAGCSQPQLNNGPVSYSDGTRWPIHLHDFAGSERVTPYRVRAEEQCGYRHRADEALLLHGRRTMP